MDVFWRKCEERKHLTHEEFDRVEELEAFIALHSNNIDECELEIARIMKKNGDTKDSSNQIEDELLSPF